MTFGNLWVLLLLPFVLLHLILANRRVAVSHVRFSSGSLFSGLAETIRQKVSRNIILLRILSCLMMIVALARPQVAIEEMKVPAKGIDIILAVDVSTSMLAEDLTSGARPKSRINAAKEVIGDFIRERQGDRIGVVVFGAHAYTACPLALDHAWLLRNLQRIEVGIVEEGTAIGSGLMTSLGRFKEDNKTGAKGKVVVLLTDGRNNTGEVPPLMAAEAANALGIKVYTVGVGTRSGALYPVRDPFGATVYKKADVELDEESLRTIAAKTGALYYRAQDAASLKRIYREIDHLEKYKREEKVYYVRRELFPLFLLPGLGLTILEFILRQTLLRRSP
jgi:Ca-activated chloride channel homolog